MLYFRSHSDKNLFSNSFLRAIAVAPLVHLFMNCSGSTATSEDMGWL